MGDTQAGFTVVESIIGIAIFIAILLAITLFAKNIFVYNTFISNSLSDNENVKKAMKTMVAEIRTASAASNGAYAVSQTSATSFTFYSDIYDNGLKERVRYFLNGASLQKGVTIPTGSPLDYNLANEQVTTLVPYVTNASIFEYYDKNYDGTTAALSSPIDVSTVRLIKITITTDKDPNKPPVATTFSTQVSIRNLKDNL